MTRFSAPLIFKSFVTLLLAAVFCAASLANARAANSENLEIAGPGGSHRFQVEVARTPKELSQGLMYRRELAATAGMLFYFGRVASVSMWMKNTYIPLDMIFIRADGTVAHIAQRAVPNSLAVIASPEPIAAVLELNGGTTSRLGIRAGDQVRHKIFGNAKP